jgi:16S rRNA (guanine527-N7)-methyltransferase
MTLDSEDKAKAWLAGAFPDVSRETWQRIETFCDLLKKEGDSQNLVARASFDHLWSRHIADSAQLALLDPQTTGRWLDLGSGAGFPGLIIAVLTRHHVTMVESRRLRIEFLHQAAEVLGVQSRVEILGMPLERVSTAAFDVISARAFAPLHRLLPLAHRFSTENTLWLLPKGRGAQSELEQVSGTWQGRFRLEPSLTNIEARIIVADRVHPRSPQKERS